MMNFHGQGVIGTHDLMSLQDWPERPIDRSVEGDEYLTIRRLGFRLAPGPRAVCGVGVVLGHQFIDWRGIELIIVCIIVGSMWLLGLLARVPLR